MEIVSVRWSYWCNSLNWTYLDDADGFLQFDTLSSWMEIVSVRWSYWCNSLNWTYLDDANGFLQFRVLIRFLDLISVPNDYFNKIRFLLDRLLVSVGVSGVIHFIGHILVMQMDSFNFGF